MRRRLLSALVFVIALGAALWYAPVHLNASAADASALGALRLVDYVDDVFRFKVSYPADFAVREYAEEEAGARTVIFEGPSPGEGFQVFVVPYDKPEITREQFLTDDPSGVMDDAQQITIDGVPAKSFFGHNDQMRDTREVWFIKNGLLYEVTTYKPLAPWLTDILLTWRFL